MSSNQIIAQSCDRVLDWVLEEDFCGWDLFDGLNSQLFQLTPLARSRYCRLAWIQFFKKSPLNFRVPTLVPKEYNPKGLGLFASGLLRLGRSSDAENLLINLLTQKSSGFLGMSWGYNFDWQARAFFVPKGKPNMVTTVFVAHAFLDYFQKTGDDKWLAPARGACSFILEHLTLEPDFCFGYIPDETTRVHNANMLGCALLGRVFSITGESVLLEASYKAIEYSVKSQKDDYSWPYGERNHHQFIDNFHTGFNLVALKEWMDYVKSKEWTNQLNNGYLYYLNTFWLDNGCPKYYNNSMYPIDIHCSAVVTCCKLASLDLQRMDMAHKIAHWAIENMQDKEGFFYYQKTRWYTNKIPYIRWSQAWMLYALSHLIEAETSDSKI
jgi:hypothetical protein